MHLSDGSGRSEQQQQKGSQQCAKQSAQREHEQSMLVSP
jgi:hypothetical protein